MNFTNPLDLIEYLKFGYQDETIDLIYFILLIRFIIWPIIYKFYLHLKKRSDT